MEKKDKKILNSRIGLTFLKILEERKIIAKGNNAKGIKDHKLVSSLRKLSAASAVDFGTVQKISKGDQGLEFFTLIDLIEALDLNLMEFAKYFISFSEEEVRDYMNLILKERKENSRKKK